MQRKAELFDRFNAISDDRKPRCGVVCGTLLPSFLGGKARIVVARDKKVFAIEPLQEAWHFGAIPREISEMPDIIAFFDHRFMIRDDGLVHMPRVLKRPVAMLDNVRMAIVLIACYPYRHHPRSLIHTATVDGAG